MKTELLIQIVNFKTKDYLRDCLESLFGDLTGIGVSYKIIVLDNDSGDDLSELSEKYKNESIAFHYSDKNMGFGGGHNFISGMEESRYTLILNSDIEFIELNSVKRLYDRISGSAYKVIGPKLLLEDMNQQRFDHGELHGIMPWIKNNYGSSYWQPRTEETEAAWVSGAVFLIETDLFKSLGGFDEKFFLYKEEEDLCRRIIDRGEKILYFPDVSVMHIGHVVAKRSEHFDNSMNYYLDKHFRNKFSYRILNNIKIIKDLLLYQEVRERK